MRLLSYNILDGGEGRADPIAEVMIANSPDIIAVSEADDAAVLDRLASRLKMDCIVGAGKRHAAAIFSRWTIRDSINHALLRGSSPRCFLEATIVDPTGNPWSIAAVHFSPGALDAEENVRERELAGVLEVFADRRERGDRHILAGDFNSNSPIQQIDPARCKPSTKRKWEENGGRIPRRVIQRLLDAGYRDTLSEARKDLSRTLGTFTTQMPGQRVDFIFGFGFTPGAIQDAWVEQDRLAKYCSDHFPVGVEIE